MLRPLINYILAIVSLFIAGCNNSSKSGQHSKKITSVNDTTAEETASLKASYKIYIENSGSMDGYISHPSQFKDVLIKFISDIPTHFTITPSLYFVNNTTCQQLPNKPTSDLVHFIQSLNPTISKKDCVPSGNSLIDNVIDFCTKDMDNTVSVVVSDCIFSLNKSGKTYPNV